MRPIPATRRRRHSGERRKPYYARASPGLSAWGDTGRPESRRWERNHGTMWGRGAARPARTAGPRGSGRGPRAGPGRDGGIASAQSGFQGSLTDPVLLWKAEPEYSDEARKAKLQGSVIMRVEIDARGQVQNIAVSQGLGLGLDDRAIEAVRQWKFRAGTRNGKPVPTNALIQVTFRLL